MRPPRRHTSQLTLGLIIIVVGVVFTLDNLNIIDASNLLRFWPALFVVWGASKLLNGCSTSDRVFGGILIFVGSVMLLNRLHIWYINIWDYWPLILVFFGISMIWRSSQRRYGARVVTSTPAAGDSDSVVHITAIMSGYDRTNASQNFAGGEITAVMGGVRLDLRRAAIGEGDAVLDIFTFWGGIELHVPENWMVINETTPIMGGVEDKTLHPTNPDAKKLVIRGSAIMGGVEVAN